MLGCCEEIKKPRSRTWLSNVRQNATSLCLLWGIERNKTQVYESSLCLYNAQLFTSTRYETSPHTYTPAACKGSNAAKCGEMLGSNYCCQS